MVDYRNVSSVDREIVRGSVHEFVPNQKKDLMAGVHITLVHSDTGNYLFEGPDFTRDGDGLVKRMGGFTPYLAIDDLYYDSFRNNVSSVLGDVFEDDTFSVVVRSPLDNTQLELLPVVMVKASLFPGLKQEAGSLAYRQQVYDLVKQGKMNWPGF